MNRVGPILGRASLVAVGLTLGLIGGCHLGNQNQSTKMSGQAHAEATQPLTAEQKSRETPLVKAIRAVAGSVVNISTEQTVKRSGHPFSGMFDNDPIFDRFFKDFYPEREVKNNSLGSGVLVDPKGIVLTNQHVLLPASKILATLGDGTTYQASLLGGDSQFDIAVLKLEGKTAFPFAKMGNSEDLMIGETVIAIGNPFGLESSVTTGVISAVNRTVRIDENRVYNGFIQTDALINPGNSGGPLININGEVIGINTAIYQQAQGIGFAIPVRRAQRIMTQLTTFGKVKRGWLGIRVKDLTSELRQHFALPAQLGGVLVTGIEESGPAKGTGISPGDVLVKVGTKSLHSRSEFNEVTSDLILGDTVTLTKFEEGKTVEVQIKASEITQAQAERVLESLVGAELSLVNQTLQQTYGLFTDKGMVVTSVVKGSQAERIGLKPGDVFRRIESVEIGADKDVQDAMNIAYGKSNFTALVQRSRQGYWVTFEF